MDILFVQALFLLMLVFLVSWFFMSIIVYFTPSIIAGIRKHEELGKIIAVNLLLGWTVIGWIGAFIWSLCPFDDEVNSNIQPTNPEGEIKQEN
ncbi:superinfection immunity protein [bacterium]|nr:superinfection immunity protein [bacterium]